MHYVLFGNFSEEAKKEERENRKREGGRLIGG